MSTTQNESKIRRLPPALFGPYVQALRSIYPGLPEEVTAENERTFWDDVPPAIRQTAIARRYPLPLFPLEQLSEEVFSIFPADVCAQSNFVPLSCQLDEGGSYLTVVTPYPWAGPDIRRDASHFLLEKGVKSPRVSIGYCSEGSYFRLIQELRVHQQRTSESTKEWAAQYGKQDDDRPILDLYEENQPANEIFLPVMEYAVSRNASDVQFYCDVDEATREQYLRVRMRIQGNYVDFHTATRYNGPTFSHLLRGRLATVCGVQDSKSRLDGKIRMLVRKPGYEKPVHVELRVNVEKDVRGHAITLRILDKLKRLPTLTELVEFNPWIGERFERLLQDPMGIVIVCGPTGSGKTTTLNLLMKEQPESLNVLTVEDPPEYELPGIIQFDLETTSVGLSKDLNPWVEILKSILRKDPDVILLGEVRDAEVAGMLANIGLTGHQAFTTLHTDRADLFAQRLEIMGANVGQVISTLNLVVSQRIVSRVCPSCSKEVHVESKQDAVHLLEKEGLPLEWSEDLVSGRCQLRRAVPGSQCGVCGGDGYHGFLTLIEGLDFQDEGLQALWSEALTRKQTVDPYRMRQYAREQKWPSLAVCALRAIYSGATDVAALRGFVVIDKEVDWINKNWAEKSKGHYTWDKYA